MKKTVVGIGEILWDCFPEYRRLGGAVTNFAIHSSRFGHDSWIVSALGRDFNAAFTESALEGLNTDGTLHYMLDRVDCPTGEVLVHAFADGRNEYEIAYPAAWDRIPVTDGLMSLASRTDVVCFGTLGQRDAVSRAAIMRFLMNVPDCCIKVFDINLRPPFYTKEVIVDSLGMCDILKINDEEVEVVRPMLDLPEGQGEACRELMRRFGLGMLILTEGAKGSTVYASEGEWFRPSEKVALVDAVGAGDSFTAAFISTLTGEGGVSKSGGRLCGVDSALIDRAQKVATRVAAFVCTQAGATPVIPDELKA